MLINGDTANKKNSSDIAIILSTLTWNVLTAIFFSHLYLGSTNNDVVIFFFPQVPMPSLVAALPLLPKNAASLSFYTVLDVGWPGKPGRIMLGLAVFMDFFAVGLLLNRYALVKSVSTKLLWAVCGMILPFVFRTLLTLLRSTLILISFVR